MLSMVAHCLLVLDYYFLITNSANMAAIMATVTAITELEKGRMEAVLLEAIVGCPTIASSGTASILPFVNSVMAVTVAVIAAIFAMFVIKKE